jgi:hypothetical protein
MNKWALIVAGLYGAAILLCSGPLVMAAFAPQVKVSEVFEMWQEWRFWVLTLLLVMAQLALLFVPVKITSRRPVGRGPFWVTAVAAALMMGLLMLGAGLALHEAVTAGKSPGGPVFAVVLALLSWGLWSVYFYRACRAAGPDERLRVVTRRLWQGSILELLIAVPAHVVARHRDYCCAGLLTFIGLSCGTAVMLFAFGPAVYFLFAERLRRLRPQG